MNKFVILTLLCILPLTSYSAEEQGEPEVKVRQMKDKVIKEYSMNGFVYAIKVIPKNGKSYFLVAEKDDSFISTEDPQTLIPKWTIFSWK